jgi:hypothetical protein
LGDLPIENILPKVRAVKDREGVLRKVSILIWLIGLLMGHVFILYERSPKYNDEKLLRVFKNRTSLSTRLKRKADKLKIKF